MKFQTDGKSISTCHQTFSPRSALICNHRDEFYTYNNTGFATRIHVRALSDHAVVKKKKLERRECKAASYISV